MGNISYAFISYACLAAAIIFAVISVLLFVRFKIRKVFSFLTGREKKMTIEKLEAENIEKGKAKAPSQRMTTSGRLKPSEGDLPDENESKEVPVKRPDQEPEMYERLPASDSHRNELKGPYHLEEDPMEEDPNEDTGLLNAQDLAAGEAGTLKISRTAPAGTKIRTETPDGGPAETELLINRDPDTVPLNAGMDETAVLDDEAQETVPLTDSVGLTEEISGKEGSPGGSAGDWDTGAPGETALLTSEREENFPEQPAEESSAEKFVVIRSIALIHTQERIQ